MKSTLTQIIRKVHSQKRVTLLLLLLPVMLLNVFIILRWDNVLADNSTLDRTPPLHPEAVYPAIEITHVWSQNCVNWMDDSDNRGVFIILRSLDGRYYMPIGSLRKDGLHSTGNPFIFSDREPKGGTNYYKVFFVSITGDLISSHPRAYPELPVSLFKTLNQENPEWMH